jgi:hypothetical protein
MKILSLVPKERKEIYTPKIGFRLLYTYHSWSYNWPDIHSDPLGLRFIVYLETRV